MVQQSSAAASNERGEEHDDGDDVLPDRFRLVPATVTICLVFFCCWFCFVLGAPPFGKRFDSVSSSSSSVRSTRSRDSSRRGVDVSTRFQR